MGGAAPPPTPPASCKPCKAASEPMNLVETHHVNIVFANGGVAPPPPPPLPLTPNPLYLSRAKRASKPMNFVETHL